MKYDNLADAKQKLAGTFCYYKGKAVFVKEVTYLGGEEPNDVGSIGLRVVELNVPSSKSINVPIDDPDLNYMQFNIGYVNQSGYAMWYYRVPSRQYKQGLHKSQCGVRDRSQLPVYHENVGLSANKATAAMLENSYPSFEEALNMVMSQDHHKVAFHKDFAVYRDNLRGDFVLEYKGYPAAFGNVKDCFKCTDHMRWLSESIQEMNLKVA